MSTQISQVKQNVSARGTLLGYLIEVSNEEMNKFRTLKSPNVALLERQAMLLAKEWDEKSTIAEEKKFYYDNISKNKDEAIENTKKAQAELASLASILAHTLEVDDTINWDALLISADYPTPKPTPKRRPNKPAPDYGTEPKESDKAFAPEITLIDRVLGKASEKSRMAHKKYLNSHAIWEQEKTDYENNLVKYENACRLIEETYKNDLSKWESEKSQYFVDRENSNKQIEEQKNKYLNKDHVAIEEYVSMVLTFSEYPDFFPKEFEIEYIPETSTIIVDYRLPYLNNIPTLKEVKYIQSRNEFTEKHLSTAELNRTFDEVIYQISLRTIHEIFESDKINAIDAVVFNGHVSFTDKSTGHQSEACIISIQASKDEFLAINLSQVDAKSCFKLLKGVGSAKLYGISPVPPIMNMRREDGRFVSAQEVANTLNDETNLAMMDWQDFEHLIREVFEKEFSVNGGEVKVTQASRDGGVDAVAFDPDPIRGGKIVIQAKRYTNTVTVSAVRDLYGTVMNEGATKGILVTTSDYGPDAYTFAKDKPLVLLNGGNLLHLLEKHGHKAKIDIAEARKFLNN